MKREEGKEKRERWREREGESKRQSYKRRKYS